jgi:hypothetical protein
MGLFDSKAKRLAQHRELLSLAKDALQRLHVEGYKTREGVHQPMWKDFDAVPLECQYWLSTYVESLVTWVYDTDESDMGKREVIADLAESVTAARSILAGIPDSVRPRLRAHAFMHLQGWLQDQVDRFSKAIATDDSFTLALMGEESLARCLSSSKTAVTWFPDYKVLDELYKSFKSSQYPKLARPSVFELQRLIEDGEKILAKVRAMAKDKSKR